MHQLWAARLSEGARGLRLRRNEEALRALPVQDTTLDAFVDELHGFSVSKGTVRLQPESPIPAPLVEKLVKARLAENLALENAKREKRR